MNEQERQDLDELEAILFRIEGTALPVTTGFRIDTADKAAWAGRKIVEAEDRIDHQRTVAEEYKRRIDEWFERTIREDRASINYLREMLKPFVLAEIQGLKKGKTLKYFGVNIAMRKLPDKADIEDEDAAILYCEEHLPQVVEIRKTLVKSVLKRALVEGYEIPGVELTPGPEEMYISGDKSHATSGQTNAA
ncbi:host-nuclease inhibitor Gam family protein [Treponema zuelzerae]|uniref:Host-nuclease inhibitor Gam family protein n=1 Tax=Teretinema zuelzerae TaxID=156 RepID=A0AAE3EKP4_9SPIR|nr:host-nuclease inhibitor Gam family protein [Teretinema zuelzerae]MCD1655518.1 host-nuclease inhibitor Gam family protein [Teretinema zuelzerae]